MKYNWQVVLNNNTTIKQFEQGKENTFKLVMDNLDKVNELQIVSEDEKKTHSVNLLTGDFNFNGFLVKTNKGFKHKLEPIFWRRNSIIMFSSKASHKIQGYIIGFKTSAKENDKYQAQFMITPEDEIIALEVK